MAGFSLPFLVGWVGGRAGAWGGGGGGGGWGGGEKMTVRVRGEKEGWWVWPGGVYGVWL